ncbi:unnamed protein product [Cuscuta epithymum]|uniref:Uncharacterized protein n=1 Tax=Cuscuta epithymum TaxID=186058 RepID=A0AAV0C0W0_9ASTE|nr:unnamed protein product [Cuscuta epithymum]
MLSCRTVSFAGEEERWCITAGLPGRFHDEERDAGDTTHCRRSSDYCYLLIGERTSLSLRAGRTDGHPFAGGGRRSQLLVRDTCLAVVTLRRHLEEEAEVAAVGPASSCRRQRRLRTKVNSEKIEV